jgi:hypothetical protein
VFTISGATPEMDSEYVFAVRGEEDGGGDGVPKSFEEAWELPEWRAAMEAEWKGFIANETGVLTDLPVGREGRHCVFDGCSSRRKMKLEERKHGWWHVATRKWRD